MSGTYLGPDRTPGVFHSSQHRLLHRHVVRADLYSGDVPQHHAGLLISQLQPELEKLSSFEGTEGSRQEGKLPTSSLSRNN